MHICLSTYRRSGNRYEKKMFCNIVAQIMFNMPVKYEINRTYISDVVIEYGILESINLNNRLSINLRKPVYMHLIIIVVMKM